MELERASSEMRGERGKANNNNNNNNESCPLGEGKGGKNRKGF